MSLLRRIVRAAGLVIGRTAQRLISWAEGAAIEGAATDEREALEVEATSTEAELGPPAHWLAAVRSRAPWLLAGNRLTARPAGVRRPMGGSVRHPREGVARGRSQSQVPAPGEPRVGDVYKEGEAEKTSAEAAKSSRSRPVGPAGDTSTSVERAVARRPAPSPDPVKAGESEDMSGPEPEVPAPAHGEERRHRPFLFASEPPVADRRSHDGTRATNRPPASQSRPEPVWIRSAESRRPPLPDGASIGAEAVPTPNTPGPGPRGPVGHHWVREDGSQKLRGQAPEGSPGQLMHPNGQSLPAAKFLPASWGEPAREIRIPGVNHDDDETADADHRWPRLPESGWQPWQTDPIEGQLREWNRRNRLAAEQAGSSWSVPPS
jgi:hypothetical protein